jgi:hypothetical protein
MSSLLELLRQAGTQNSGACLSPMADCVGGDSCDVVAPGETHATAPALFLPHRMGNVYWKYTDRSEPRVSSSTCLSPPVGRALIATAVKSRFQAGCRSQRQLLSSSMSIGGRILRSRPTRGVCSALRALEAFSAPICGRGVALLYCAPAVRDTLWCAHVTSPLS